jgi:hypothetical protein
MSTVLSWQRPRCLRRYAITVGPCSAQFTRGTRLQHHPHRAEVQMPPPAPSGPPVIPRRPSIAAATPAPGCPYAAVPPPPAAPPPSSGRPQSGTHHRVQGSTPDANVLLSCLLPLWGSQPCSIRASGGDSQMEAKWKGNGSRSWHA